jgi:acetyl esterase/lipase
VTVHVLDRPAPDPDEVLSSGAGPTGVVDVFAPSGAERGVLILLHGGFWRAAYDRVHLRALAAALAADGWRTALPEYRRIGDFGGGMPGTLDDIDEILRVVPGLLGATPADAVVAGHSAGGHLAVLAASRAEVPPARVVSLAGVLDIRTAHTARLSRGAVGELLGTPDPAATDLAAIDPMQQPLPSCALALVHGTMDAEVPVAYTARFAARDPRIRLDVVEGADHYDLIDPLSDAYPRVLAAL